ncbi:MAG: Sir2 family NAD-dependent protein deacetylase [Dehalococcoidia bacterium]
MVIESLIQRAAQDLIKSKYAIALTGAGMSTESGIPDFRGPNGVWTKNPEAERMAYQTYSIFLNNPVDYWEIRLTQPYMISGIEDARPNSGHYALFELEQLNIIKGVVTQNIDGLHVKAGNRRVMEFHGSVSKLRCVSCGARFNLEEYDLEALRVAKQLPPICNKCNSPLKSDVVHFNEPIPSDIVQESMEEAYRCDLMLICGTSAVVYPFAELPRIARQRGMELRRQQVPDNSSENYAPRVIIIEVNADRTPLTTGGISDYILQGNTGEILPEIVKAVSKELS